MITNIDINKIYPHPENPRKDIGDIQELTESIKKNGVMQNLTVIPGHWKNGVWEEDDYTLIIGHRRHAASKAAGLKELPCKIVELDYREQIATMLEENMQRSDLTIYEQAQGFQLMLDLGENVETVAKKTGFSKSTIHHRLNIAKLDGEELKKRENGEFQLSLKDLYELEKIKSVKKRNQILKESHDSRDLIWRAQRAANEEKEEENLKILIPKLEALGIKKMSKSEENQTYTEKFTYQGKIELHKELPEEIKIKGTHWKKGYCGIEIYKENPVAKRKEEKEEKERKKTEKQIKDVMKRLGDKRKEFVKFVIQENIKPINGEEKMTQEIWNLLLKKGCSLACSSAGEIFAEKTYWSHTGEERKEIDEKVKKLSMLQQMLCLLNKTMNTYNNIAGYRNEYLETEGNFQNESYELLKFYGWSFDGEEEEIIDGSSKLYRRKADER